MMADELIGKTLGQYEIRMVLGRGGMSSVYLAYQPSMDRVVAIKVLPREFLHDDTFLLRFQQEARTIARLEHLHILPVYDVGEDQGIPYIVMRYLSGGTLADLIADHLPDNATVARIVDQVAGALDHAHLRGIIHRDLKPSNVLLDSSGNAYLADFGIARVAQAATGLTGSRVIGTPTYIAPEMVQKGPPITGSADIYALGIIVYEMLTGVPPYEDEDPTKTMMSHVMDPVPSVRDADPNLSAEVDAVVRKALAKTPGERYATASEFARTLSAALIGQRRPDAEGTHHTVAAPITGEEGPTTEPGEPEQAARLRARPARRSGGLPAWLIVLGVFVALIGGVVVTALAITDGNPARLLVLLTPIPTRTPQPTVTPTAGLVGEATTPVEPTARPTYLPPPSGGDRLAFASNRAGHFDIYLIDIDGSNLRRLTDQPGPDFDPAWSPDGTQIVYVSRPSLEENAHLWIMNADGSDKQPITDGPADDINPDWSPDGEWIAFASNRGGNFDIYLVRPDGSGLRAITEGNLNELSPRWAGNGVLIAYHARAGNQSAGSELYIMDSSGGVPNQLTDNDFIDQWPDWSPDSLRLAFTSGNGLPGGQRAIFVLDFATNVVTQVTEGQSHDDDPAWSPDGTRIAFDSDRDGDGVFDLFVLNLTAGEVARLTDNSGDNVTPVWQPR